MVRFPSWAVLQSTARCRSSAANSPFVHLFGMPKLTKPPAKASNRCASTRSWKISNPISASSTNGSATGIRMSRPKRSAMPSWVWVMIVACCCRPSTNTSQAFSNVWARIVVFRPSRTATIPAVTSPLS